MKGAAGGGRALSLGVPGLLFFGGGGQVYERQARVMVKNGAARQAARSWIPGHPSVQGARVGEVRGRDVALGG